MSSSLDKESILIVDDTPGDIDLLVGVLRADLDHGFP
jgi:hypothetical protein